MTLVLATETDLPLIVDLMNRAYRGSEGWAVEHGYIEGDRVRLTDLKAEIAETPDMRLFVWREDGGLLGCVSLEMQPGGVGYVGMLTVEPGRQDQQLGRRLLAEVERLAQSDGATLMRMSVVWVREALIAWYQRRGYRQSGETRSFPYEDDRWGRPTRDDLHFVVLEKPLERPKPE